MKFFKHISCLVFALMVFAACESNLEKVEIDLSQAKPAVLSVMKSPIVITKATRDSTEKISWNASDYGFSAAVTYILEMALAGDNFKNSVTISSVQGQTDYTLSRNNLNDFIAGLVQTHSLQATGTADFEFRVGSTIGGNSGTIYSNVVKSTISYYEDFQIRQLYVPGEHSGWGHSVFIYSTKLDVPFSGYMYLAGQFKFSSQADWNGANYGDGGEGKLSTSGENLSLPEGFYYLTVDIDNLTWSSKVATWSVIGSAVGGWEAINDVPMTPKAGNILSVTTDLSEGEFKFRLNSSWDTNLGSVGGSVPDLKDGGDNITVSEAGNYTITLDMSTPPDYRFSITKN